MNVHFTAYIKKKKVEKIMFIGGRVKSGSGE